MPSTSCASHGAISSETQVMQMDRFHDQLISFQESLVHASLSIAGIGATLIAFGVIVSSTSPGFSYRISRLGKQTLAAVFFLLVIHALSIKIFAGDIPLSLLVGTYGIIGLMILQATLNLFFGPSVGNTVVSKLLSGIILLVLSMLVIRYIDLFPIWL